MKADGHLAADCHKGRAGNASTTYRKIRLVRDLRARDRRERREETSLYPTSCEAKVVLMLGGPNEKDRTWSEFVP